MPSPLLMNLGESVLFYWLKLIEVTRRMVTFWPDMDNPTQIDGQKVSWDEDRACKLKSKSFIN